MDNKNNYVTVDFLNRAFNDLLKKIMQELRKDFAIKNIRKGVKKEIRTEQGMSMDEFKDYFDKKLAMHLAETVAAIKEIKRGNKEY